MGFDRKKHLKRLKEYGTNDINKERVRKISKPSSDAMFNIPEDAGEYVIEPLLTDSVAIQMPYSDDEDHENIVKATRSNPSFRRFRRPSIRTVSGSTHSFTVINYDTQSEDEVDSGMATAVSSTNLDNPIYSGAEDTLSNHYESPPHSLLQRSLSIHDEQGLRSALKKKDIITEPKANGVAYSPSIDGHDFDAVVEKNNNEVYKTWDWKRGLNEVARWGRLFGKRKRDRLVHKSGECNIAHINQAKKRKRYIQDSFTTLLELKWRNTIILLVFSFVFSWIVFALIWWGIVEHTSHFETPCIDGVTDFVTALLFSIETQQTIGYGTRAVTDECPIAVLLIMIQSVVGVVLQCILTGLIFAKLARAKKRGETLMFSKHAVINRYHGHLCLMFRIADMRRSHMICVTVNAILVSQRQHNIGLTGEEESQGMRQFKLDIFTETDDFYFLAMPVRLIHKIDENSPLYDITPDRLVSDDYEIIVVLEGVNETTGMTTQVRTSYLPGEIMWGHQHAPLVTHQGANGRLNIDYSKFNEVIPVDTPELSAKDLKSIGRDRRRSTISFGANRFHPQISTVVEDDEDDDVTKM